MSCPGCQKDLETVSVFHLRDCLSDQTTLDGAEKAAAVFNERFIEKKGLVRRREKTATLEVTT